MFLYIFRIQKKENQSTDENKKKHSSAPTSTSTSTENETKSANDLKEQGNKCVRAGNHSEAVLHYSFAIKLSPNDPLLYSNRSLAFLKLNQLYYANEDAEKTIQLKPDWAKVSAKKNILYVYVIRLVIENCKKKNVPCLKVALVSKYLRFN